LNRRGFDDPGAEFRGVAQARHRPRRLHHRPRWNRALRGLGRPRQLRADTNTVTVVPPITPHPQPQCGVGGRSHCAETAPTTAVTRPWEFAPLGDI